MMYNTNMKNKRNTATKTTNLVFIIIALTLCVTHQETFSMFVSIKRGLGRAKTGRTRRTKRAQKTERTQKYLRRGYSSQRYPQFPMEDVVRKTVNWRFYETIKQYISRATRMVKRDKTGELERSFWSTRLIVARKVIKKKYDEIMGKKHEAKYRSLLYPETFNLKEEGIKFKQGPKLKDYVKNTPFFNFSSVLTLEKELRL